MKTFFFVFALFLGVVQTNKANNTDNTMDFLAWRTTAYRELAREHKLMVQGKANDFANICVEYDAIALNINTILQHLANDKPAQEAHLAKLNLAIVESVLLIRKLVEKNGVMGYKTFDITPLLADEFTLTTLPTYEWKTAAEMFATTPTVAVATPKNNTAIAPKAKTLAMPKIFKKKWWRKRKATTSKK